MQTNNPYDIKRLSYRIRGYDKDTWKNEGYDISFRGVEAKFKQNPMLLSMLCTTKGKILVQATSDHLWGTGVQLPDTNVLNADKWYGHGWLLTMLETLKKTL